MPKTMQDIYGVTVANLATATGAAVTVPVPDVVNRCTMVHAVQFACGRTGLGWMALSHRTLHPAPTTEDDIASSDIWALGMFDRFTGLLQFNPPIPIIGNQRLVIWNDTGGINEWMRVTLYVTTESCTPLEYARIKRRTSHETG